MSVRAYNEKEGVAGYGGEMAQLDVVCIGLSRAQAREEYRAQDYQVPESCGQPQKMLICWRCRFVCWREIVFLVEKYRLEKNLRELLCAS